MRKPPLRTKSVGTKVSEEEYTRLEELAGAAGLSMSEWVRGILLDREKANEETVLAELLGLRAILLNLLFTQAKGEAMTAEQMQAVIGGERGKRGETGQPGPRDFHWRRTRCDRERDAGPVGAVFRLSAG